jgi:hypothetical protein
VTKPAAAKPAPVPASTSGSHDLLDEAIRKAVANPPKN